MRNERKAEGWAVCDKTKSRTTWKKNSANIMIIIYNTNKQNVVGDYPWRTCCHMQSWSRTWARPSYVKSVCGITRKFEQNSSLVVSSQWVNNKSFALSQIHQSDWKMNRHDWSRSRWKCGIMYSKCKFLETDYPSTQTHEVIKNNFVCNRPYNAWEESEIE